MSESKDKNAFHIIERLAANLTNASQEVRERSASSLLLKLDLRIIPRPALLNHYHHTIGRCLEALNQHLPNLRPGTAQDLINILGHFAGCSEGRELLKRYGCVQFMGELLEHVRREKKGAIAESIEVLLRGLCQGGNFPIKEIARGPKTESQLIRERLVFENWVRQGPEKCGRTVLPFKRVMENLDNEIELDVLLTFKLRKLGLAESEKANLVELITQIRFCDRREIRLGSSLGGKILSVVRSHPFEIYFSQFSELLIEVLKLAVETGDRHFAVQLISQALDSFVQQAKNNKRFSVFSFHENEAPNFPRNFKANDNFAEVVYPPLADQGKKNQDPPVRQKLSLANICELLFRTCAALFTEDGLTAILAEKFSAFAEFLAGEASCVESRRVLASLLLRAAEFYELTLLGPQGQSAAEMGPVRSLSISRHLLRLFSAIWGLHFCLGESKRPFEATRFSFCRFVTWAAEGLFSSNELEALQTILEEADPQSARELAQLEKLQQSVADLFLIQQEFKNAKIGELADHIKRASTFGNSVRALFLFEMDILPFVETFAVAGHFLSKPEFREIFSSDQANFCREYISGFVQFCEIVLFVEKCTETRSRLLGAFKTAAKSNLPLQANFGAPTKKKLPEMSISEALVLSLHKTDLLNLIIISCAEREPFCPLLEAQVLELLAEILASTPEIDSACDPYLLANLLSSSATASKLANSLQGFLGARSPWFAKLSAAVQLSSKDVFRAYQKFSELALGFEGEKDGGSNSEGGGFRPRISPGHPFFGLVDELGGARILRSELEILAGLSSSSSRFLGPEDLKDLGEILAISANEQIREEIRQKALQQIFEALVSLRGLREAKTFSASVANLAFERLFKCEPGALSGLHLKILLSFWLQHSFNSGLKLKMLENLRGICRASEFRPLTKLLEFFLKSEDPQLRLNILALVQITVGSPDLWEVKFFAQRLNLQKLNSGAKVESAPRLLKTLSENSSVSESAEDLRKFSILKCGRGSLHNFTGAKEKVFGPRIISLIGCSSSIIEKIAPSQNWRSAKQKVVVDLVEERLRSAKNLFLSNADIYSPSLEVGQIVSVTLLFRIFADFITDESLKKNLREALKALHREILPRIVGLAFDKLGLKIFGMALSELSITLSNFGFDGKDEENFGEDWITDFANTTIGPALDSKLMAEKENLGILCNALHIWAQNAPCLLNKAFLQENRILEFASRNFSSETITIALESLCFRKNQLKDPQVLSNFSNILQKAAATFSSPSIFSEVKAKIAFLSLIREKISSADPANIISNFDYFLRVKELTRSGQTELRLRAWNLLLIFAERLNSQACGPLAAEILFKCGEHFSSLFDFEHPVVNDQILSIVICLLSRRNFGGEGDAPLNSEFWRELLKKLAKRPECFSAAGLAGLIALCKILAGDGNFLSEALMMSIYEFIAKTVLSFQRIEKMADGTKIDGETEENGRSVICGVNLTSWAWIAQIFSFPKENGEYNFDFESCNEILMVPIPLLKSTIKYIAVRESKKLAEGKLPFFENIASSQLDAIIRELKNQIEGILLLVHELLNKFLDKIKDPIFKEDSQTIIPIFLFRKFSQLLQFITLPFFQSLGFKNSNLLEFVLAKLALGFSKIPGVGEPELVCIILSLSRILESQKFKSEALEKICLSSCCFLIKRLRGKSENIKIDDLKTGTSFTSEILISKFAQKIGQVSERLWEFREPLSWILANSAKAKRSFIFSQLPFHINKEFAVLGSELSESESAKKLLAIFLNLFIPLPSSKYTLIKSADFKNSATIPTNLNNSKARLGKIFSEQELESLKIVYLTLSKTFTCGAEKPVYDVLTNWHLNTEFSPFLETLTLKGKHFILDRSIELSKLAQTLREPEFISALRFLRSVASVDFLANYIVKAKVPLSLTAKMQQLYFADKRDQLVALNLKAVVNIVDFFLALSFNRITHLKILEGGSEHFEVLKYFYAQTKDETLLRKFEVLFTNLAVTKTAKAMFLEWPEFVRRMQKTFVLSKEVKFQVLASQFFYNLLYREASAVALFEKREFVRELELVSSEAKIAMGRQGPMEERKGLDLLLKNIKTVKDILLVG